MARRKTVSPQTAATARLIETQADLAAGVLALTRTCPAMAAAHALAGDPPLRRWPDGFAGLVRIVSGQQLSTASARAIHGRLVAAIDPLTVETFVRTPDDVLRGCGLSSAKIETLRGLAGAAASGALDFPALARLEAGGMRERLIAQRGIGPWTADIYLMFCRGEADAFAPGDLALQIGVQKLLALDERPGPAAIEEIARRWRPWRGVAARLIWAYYGAVKSAGPQKTPATAPSTPAPKARRRPPGRGGTRER